jgi:hypothetical protein
MNRVAGLVVCVLASTTLSAMTVAGASAAPAAYKAPRNGFGQPELSGTWTSESLTRMERPAEYGNRLILTPEEVAKLEGARAERVKAGSQPTGSQGEKFRSSCETAAGAFGPQCGYNEIFFDTALKVSRINGQPRSSFITFPANGRIPRKNTRPRGDGREEGIRDNPENRGLADRCLVGQSITTGALLNSTIYNNTFVFQQSKDTVVFVAEMSHEPRIVRIGGVHDNIPRWLGDSVGHWEGDTLVVDTVGFHPEQLTLNSDKMHLVERFTRVAADGILYQFRVEDPGAYTEAWGGEYVLHTSKGPQYEYACHEGNYAMEGILAGARQAEAEAAKSGRAVAQVKEEGEEQ